MKSSLHITKILIIQTNQQNKLNKSLYINAWKIISIVYFSFNFEEIRNFHVKMFYIVIIQRDIYDLRYLITVVKLSIVVMWVVTLCSRVGRVPA
jgi:hypothetical protein